MQVQDLTGYPFFWRVVLTVVGSIGALIFVWARKAAKMETKLILITKTVIGFILVFIGCWVRPEPKKEDRVMPALETTVNTGTETKTTVNTGTVPMNSTNNGDHSQTFQANTLTVNQGATPEEVAKISRESYAKGYQDAMDEAKQEKGGALQAEYRSKYALCYLTPNRVIPDANLNGVLFKVDWSGSSVQFEGDRIRFVMPSIHAGPFVLRGNVAYLPRQAGFRMNLGGTAQFTLYAEVVSVREDGLVVAVGLQPK